ncbi:Autophagy-related protein 18h [Forsythia ovata]|uniref:Autophagy-related protein 18h n=1 Tax=Forsythia ovata TaxID=205694 RepID=A0ABD1X0T1_9LAMI
MPSQMRSESGCHGWSTSYVHLYKLHRGITTAVIQDICFSHDNQWIAIVSSKGTCHIFVISPFGGDTGIQALHSHIQGSILYPDSSPPWWPTSSFAVNEKCSSPPPPCTLSVVSRIKSSDSVLIYYSATKLVAEIAFGCRDCSATSFGCRATSATNLVA